MTNSLRVEALRAGYGGSLVVDGVSFDVEAGGSLAILGPNGSGKSTVAKAVLGLCRTYEGEVTWNGQSLIEMPTWRRVRVGLGYVPQVANVFPSLTVNENLRMGAVGLSSATLRSSLSDIYDLFPGLAQRLTVPAGKLSGGERRMLSFATALVQAPDLLILDEPTSDLAPAAIDAVADRIETVVAEMGLSLLLIEQNVPMALSLAARYSVIVRGKIRHTAPSAAANEDEIADMFLERTRGQSALGDTAAHAQEADE